MDEARHEAPPSPHSSGPGASHEPAESARLPLAGIKVLDVTQVMAGPFSTMLLADLGADVIKIEPPGGGDQTRGSMGFKMKGTDSMGFLNLNRNKRSVALNLKNPAGRAAFLKLAETADVVIENYRPGVVKRLGINYEVVAAINPRIIYASISGFGQTGPWADRPGFDLMAQAMSGIMSVTGHPGGPPVKAGVPVADIGCALFATYAILAAFIGCQKTGRGQFIDASLFEAALAFSIWDISDYWGTGQVPTPLGTANRMSAPYQAVKAADGYFVVGATNQKLWNALCQEIGRSELLDDARFTDIPKRLANREQLIAELEITFATKSAEDWIAQLMAAGIPVGRVHTYPEAFESDHGVHREMRLEIEHPVEGKIPNIGFPVKMTGTPQQIRRHPPLLGEHTDEVLGGAGFDTQAIEDLRKQGAFHPMSADQGRVTLKIEGGVAYILFDRPSAHNAMTWAMYDALAEACAAIDADKNIRVAILRGTGGKAFISGTDISQFKAFASGEDGLAYEAKIDHFVETVERLRVPSIAAVEGYAVGGGLAIANACDIRIATPGARFGVPIARTLGNCLSAANIRKLCATLGVAWVKRMLLLAEMPTAEMLVANGYVAAIVAPDALDAEIARLAERLLSHAPLTMCATRETLRRLALTPEPDIADLIRSCYGSADFHRAVEAFATKTQVAWEGS